MQGSPPPQAQTLSFKTLYQNDESVQRRKSIMALPLVPTSQVADAFRNMQDNSPENLAQTDKM